MCFVTIWSPVLSLVEVLEAAVVTIQLEMPAHVGHQKGSFAHSVCAITIKK